MSESQRAAAVKPEPKVERAPAENRALESRPSASTLHSQILHQQRTIGNRAVQRLVNSGALKAASRRGRDAGEKTDAAEADVSSHETSAYSLPSRNLALAPAAPIKPVPSPTVQASSQPRVDRHWYNFSIPFTGYELDPSLDGLKTAGNLVADKAKEGSAFVKDKAVELADALIDKIKGIINGGVEWMTGKFNDIKEYAVSSFTDVKSAVSGALVAITSPLSAIQNAMGAMDAGLLSAAFRALTAGANAAFQAVKTVVNGVLKVGGGIWDTVSKYVGSLFGTIDDLLTSSAFNLLPDVVQSPIRGLYKTVHDLWTSIEAFWNDLWKRLTTFVNNLLDSIQSFVQKVTSFAIDVVIATIKKIKEAFDFVQRVTTDPESVIRPLLDKVAAKIETEAPGKSKEYAHQKMAQVASSNKAPSSPGPVVQRAPDSAAPARTTTSRADIDANCMQVLSMQWAGLNIKTMLWDTVVNMFYPPATVKAIGKEFSELWNTDWKNTVSELYTPRNMFDDFGGFWHDVWSNFLTLLDFPMALWRRLNNILMLLMGWVTILLLFVGIVGGAIFGGGVPGAIAGAGAAAELAGAIGTALFASFLATEAITVIKVYTELLTALKTEAAKDRDYLQFAASVIGIGIGLTIFLLFQFLGALVKLVIGKIKGGSAATPKTPPKAPGVDPVPGGRTTTKVPGLEDAIDPKKPAGGFKFQDDVQTSSGETTVTTNVTAPDGSTGMMNRGFNPNTGEVVFHYAFLDGIPKEMRWVPTDPPMVAGKGTPLETYMTMRQMKMLESETGKAISAGAARTIKLSTIVNDRTLAELAKAAPGAKPPSPAIDKAILDTHSVQYAQNSITQTGGKISAARVEGGTLQTARQAGISTEAMTQYGLKPSDTVLSGFDIILDVVPADGAAPPAVKPSVPGAIPLVPTPNRDDGGSK